MKNPKKTQMGQEPQPGCAGRGCRTPCVVVIFKLGLLLIGSEAESMGAVMEVVFPFGMNNSCGEADTKHKFVKLHKHYCDP